MGGGAAKAHILAGGLDVVISDLEGAASVVGPEPLRIGADLLKVADVGIDHRDIGAIHLYPTPIVGGRVTVNVAPIENDVMRQRCRGSVRVADDNHLIHSGCGYHSEFDTDEAEMMTVCNGHQGVVISRRDNFRHVDGVIGADALTGSGETR